MPEYPGMTRMSLPKTRLSITEKLVPFPLFFPLSILVKCNTKFKLEQTQGKTINLNKSKVLNILCI